MSDLLPTSERPENYRAPSWKEVASIREALIVRRQPVIDRIWKVKRIRRGQWEDVVSHIPAAYRKMLVTPDLPVVRDMLQRVTGLISKQEPLPEVIPPSSRTADVNRAAKEEARLHALRVQIEDQQDRSAWAMGVDAQGAWGESWISVWPAPERIRELAREKGEAADDYSKRHGAMNEMCGVPIRFLDHDPQSVLPYFTDDKLVLAIIESEHQVIDINLGLGLKPIRNPNDGKVAEWAKGTFGEPMVLNENRNDGTIVDPNHALTLGGSSTPQGDSPVKRTIYLDQWSYQMFIDGILVEQWEHNFGVVPLFWAAGEQTSDRDPAWQTVGIADAAISVAKQIVMFSAILASNAMQHGYPTAFLRNAVTGLVHPVTGEPLTRKIVLGEMNLLADGEEIEFPYLNAKMMPDFFKHMQWLSEQLEGATLSNFGKAINSDMAGYAIAQIRSMQLSILSTIYTNATRQWRKIFYFCRFLIKTLFRGGIRLRAAVEEERQDDGTTVQYRPVVEFGEEHTTEYTINVHIPEGIAQDEMAEKKMAIELMQNKVWSRRRAMETTGVDDPAAEKAEIMFDDAISSPDYLQRVMEGATLLAANRLQSVDQQQQSGPFAMALQRARQGAGPGSFQNQPGLPQNSMAGIPQNQMGAGAGPGGGQQNGNPQNPLGLGGTPPGGGLGGIHGQRVQPGGVPGGQPLPTGAPG